MLLGKQSLHLIECLKERKRAEATRSVASFLMLKKERTFCNRNKLVDKKEEWGIG